MRFRIEYKYPVYSPINDALLYYETQEKIIEIDTQDPNAVTQIGENVLHLFCKQNTVITRMEALYG